MRGYRRVECLYNGYTDGTNVPKKGTNIGIYLKKSSIFEDR